jgi:hypothetical protein
MTNILVIVAPSRGNLLARAPRYRHRRPQARRAAPNRHPRPGHRPRTSRKRSLHRYSRGGGEAVRTRGHPSAPLGLHDYRENNHKTCEDDLANHDSHLKARPAESFTNNLSSIPTKRDAPGAS